MLFSTRFVAGLLAALPLAAAYPPLLTRQARDEFCQTEANPAVLAMHEKIVNQDPATMAKINQGEAVIQAALNSGDGGLHAARAVAPGMTVTKRDTGELITLDAWIHVVFSSNSSKGGYVPVRNSVATMHFLPSFICTKRGKD